LDGVETCHARVAYGRVGFGLRVKIIRNIMGTTVGLMARGNAAEEVMLAFIEVN
jgi:hypothetical protein